MKHARDDVSTIQVLVVTRDTATRTFLKQVLTRGAYRILNATSRKEAMALLAREEPGLVILDSHAAAPPPAWKHGLETRPGSTAWKHGRETLRQLLAKRPELPVILITQHGSIQTAMEAMRLGAADYLTKPLDPVVVAEAVSASLCKTETLVGSMS